MIKYQVAVGDVTLKYCPTEIIMADHFTKPPQGIIIQKFRVEIQGIPGYTVNADLFWDQTYKYVVPIPQECVVGNGISAEPILQDNGKEAERGIKGCIS